MIKYYQKINHLKHILNIVNKEDKRYNNEQYKY